MIAYNRASIQISRCISFLMKFSLTKWTHKLRIKINETQLSQKYIFIAFSYYRYATSFFTVFPFRPLAYPCSVEVHFHGNICSVLLYFDLISFLFWATFCTYFNMLQLAIALTPCLWEIRGDTSVSISHTYILKNI